MFFLSAISYNLSIMKKYLTLILLLFLFITCGNSNDLKNEPIELNTDKISFEEGAGSQFVSVTTTADWSVISDATSNWITVEPKSGSGNARVKLTVPQNTTGNARVANLNFKTAGGKTAVLEVLQKVAEAYIIINPTSIEALTAGQEAQVEVSSNASWTVEIPADAQSWITLNSKTASKVLFDIKPNAGVNDRNAEVVFKLANNEKSASLTVSQKSKQNASDISINPTSVNAPIGGGIVRTNVSAGVEWYVKIPTTDTWVKMLSKESNLVTFSVDPNYSGNDRSSTVSIETIDGKSSVNFMISQAKGYTLTSEFSFGDDLIGKPYTDLHNYVRNYGFDYSEHPHCTGGYGGHSDGVHLVVEKDYSINKNVFRFNIHIDPVIDGDRCSSSTVDRQRNELKTASNNSTWAKVQGNYDEWQVLEWKFKIPKGYQPTSSFCHIHQIKAHDGPNNGSPVITITPRSNSDGSNRRMQLIHSVDGGTGKALGTFVDNVPLSEFEDEWVQVREEIHYTHTGYYSCTITRISDGKVLINTEQNNIDMWRKGASYLRSKYGIYRSLAGGNLSRTPIGQSPLLKNESIWMYDFKVYERNANPNPSVPVD